MIRIDELTHSKSDYIEPQTFPDDAKFLDVMKFFFDSRKGPNASFIVENRMISFEK